MAKHNSGTAISVNGLKKSFGENPVIWDLNLELEWGKFLALFGTNGSGKTTLLKILASQIEAEDRKSTRLNPVTGESRMPSSA